MAMTGGDRTTVLIVEDEPELADSYAGWLEDEYHVMTAHSGEEALDRLAEEPVEVVLLDRRLPDIPGNEVLDELRDRGHDSRVAMITAVDPDFDILEMAIDDYVVKPVLKRNLRTIVESLVRLADCDDLIQESFSLSSKLRALAAEKPAHELERHDEYQRLADRLERLRDRVDRSIVGLEKHEIELIYRDIDRGDGASD